MRFVQFTILTDEATVAEAAETSKAARTAQAATIAGAAQTAQTAKAAEAAESSKATAVIAKATVANAIPDNVQDSVSRVVVVVGSVVSGAGHGHQTEQKKHSSDLHVGSEKKKGSTDEQEAGGGVRREKGGEGRDRGEKEGRFSFIR